MSAAATKRTRTGSKRSGVGAPARVRDRSATQERILEAVGEVLARDGFAGIGVNAIARQSGIDKVLIYRYFGGLPELLRAWGSSGRFWPSVEEMLGESPEDFLALPEPERFALFFDRFIDALRARPLTVEILAAEIVEHNVLTAILEAEREQWGAQIEATLGGEAFASNPALRGITLILVAGVQYLMVRARRLRVFGGVDLHSEAGWNELKRSIRAMAAPLLLSIPPGRATERSGTLGDG